MLAHAISRAFGKFANTKFPHTIQNFINSSYCNLLKLNMNEFLHPKEYESLCLLFTRELIKKREVAKNIFICPTDSFIMAQGEISKNTALQIKGKSYNIEEFVDEKLSNFENGEFINFYLSPKDYHRYHAPCDMQILSAKHIPGELFPVNRPALNYIKSLFARNERVVLTCKYNEDIFYMVMVGALNVGKMKFYFDEQIQTNVKHTLKTEYKYENLHVKKGDELGCFEMGSTVVLILPNGFIKMQNKENMAVKFSEDLSID